MVIENKQVTSRERGKEEGQDRGGGLRGTDNYKINKMQRCNIQDRETILSEV